MKIILSIYQMITNLIKSFNAQPQKYNIALCKHFYYISKYIFNISKNINYPIIYICEKIVEIKFLIKHTLHLVQGDNEFIKMTIQIINDKLSL